MDNTQNTKSIRAFIGARDYELSKSFYRDLGFEEKIISDKMSLFEMDDFYFYLQDYYVKDWIENSMLLLEVGDVQAYYSFLQGMELDKKYPTIKLIAVQENEWGNVCFLIDPSGVLWHFAEFRR